MSSLFFTNFIFIPNRYNKAKNDLLQAEKNIQQLETHNNELNAALNQAKSDRVRAVEENAVSSTNSVSLINRILFLLFFQNLISERDALTKQVPELQQQLEAELLARTDLENRNTTLREELAFKHQVYKLRRVF